MARLAVFAMKPMSNAALRLAEEDRARVQQLLDHRFTDARLVRDPAWLNEDVLECLFVTDGQPRVAWICRSGAVQIFDSWEVP